MFKFNFYLFLKFEFDQILQRQFKYLPLMKIAESLHRRIFPMTIHEMQAIKSYYEIRKVTLEILNDFENFFRRIEGMYALRGRMCIFSFKQVTPRRSSTIWKRLINKENMYNPGDKKRPHSFCSAEVHRVNNLSAIYFCIAHDSPFTTQNL